MLGIPIFAIMTEPLIMISRITQADYDHVSRRAANMRALVRAICAVLALLALRSAYLRFQEGESFWTFNIGDSVLGNTLLGIGLIVGPWQGLRNFRRKHTSRPMLEQDVEFRFYSDRFTFRDENGLQEFYWRDIRRSSRSGPILIIVSKDRVIYFVNIGRLTAEESEQIMEGYRRNRPQKGIMPPQRSA